MGTSKTKYMITVEFTVKAASELEAKEYVDRLLRHGLTSVYEYERPTWKAIKRWVWGN